MTVHKAKGLEFPVVILADLTTRMTGRTGANGSSIPAAGCVRSGSAGGLHRNLWTIVMRKPKKTARKQCVSPTSQRRARAICWW